MLKSSFYNVIVILLTLILAACLTNTKEEDEAAKMIGQDVYLKLNVWYTKPTKIGSTNYHRGTLLNVGEKFKIVNLGRKKIVFTDKDGIKYAIIHYRKHTSINLPQLIDRYFSKTSVMSAGGAYKKFTKNEQKNIRIGQIVTGMSKAAVLMAYGYPPEHRTPSLDSDRWVYWTTKWVSKAATFKNGKLVSYE